MKTPLEQHPLFARLLKEFTYAGNQFEATALRLADEGYSEQEIVRAVARAVDVPDDIPFMLELEAEPKLKWGHLDSSSPASTPQRSPVPFLAYHASDGESEFLVLVYKSRLQKLIAEARQQTTMPFVSMQLVPCRDAYIFEFEADALPTGLVNVKGEPVDAAELLDDLQSSGQQEMVYRQTSQALVQDVRIDDDDRLVCDDKRSLGLSITVYSGQSRVTIEIYDGEEMTGEACSLRSPLVGLVV